MESFDGEASNEISVLVSSDSAEEFDEDVSTFEPISLVLRGDDLLIGVSLWDSEFVETGLYSRTLLPLLDRRDAGLAATDEGAGKTGSWAQFLIRWTISQRVVRDALDLGTEVLQLLKAARGGELAPSTTLDLLRAGRWNLLVGQPESQWLDAKREPYDRKKPHWQYEFAKDVAAFANSDAGGLIVFGLTASDRGDGEIITGRHFFPLEQINRQAYRSMIARLVYPRVVGLEIERIEIEEAGAGAGIAVVVVPSQPESARPFLVHGLVQQRDVLGSHILLPYRHEDETRSLDPAALHARIRLGEDVLAGRIPRAMPRERPSGLPHDGTTGR